MSNTQNGPVGIIGGMSWESTLAYYREINRGYNGALGGHASAPILIYSVDFAPIEAMQRRGDWDGTAEILAAAAAGLERAGARFLLLATNTMHLVYDRLVEATTVPWIHIADATGEALARDGRTTVGLLGTRFTMEQPFYRDRLTAGYGLSVLVPDDDARREVDCVIFDELVHGETLASSRETYRSVMATLVNRGAEAIILGCTEIGLLVSPEDASVPLYDTTLVHAAAAVERLLTGTRPTE